MPISHRTKRVRVYSYTDAGADGYVGSSYALQASSDADAAWWASVVAPSGRELAYAAQNQHSVEKVIGLDAHVPVTENGIVVDVESGESYRVTAVLPREYGRDELQVLAVHSDEAEPTLVAAVVPARVIVTPATADAATGTQVAFTATVEESDGTPILGYAVVWQSLAPAGATIDAASGLATIVDDALPATVVATIVYNGTPISGSATVNGGAAAVAVGSVTIEPDPAVVAVGATTTVTVRAWAGPGGTGAELAGTAVAVAAAEPDLATIDVAGGVTPLVVTVTGVADGVAQLAAAAGSAVAVADVQVGDLTPPAVVGSVTIAPDPIALDVGESVPVTIRAFDAGAVELVGEAIGVSADDGSVFTVDGGTRASGVTPFTVTVAGVAAGDAVLAAAIGSEAWLADVAVSAVGAADPGPVLTGLTQWYRPEAAQVASGALTERQGTGRAMQLGSAAVGDTAEPDWDAARNMVFGDSDDSMLAAAANVGTQWALHWCMEFPGSKPAPTTGVSPLRLCESASLGDYALYIVLNAVSGYNIVRGIVRASGGTTAIVRTTATADDPTGRPVDYLLQREASGDVVLYMDGAEVGRLASGTVAKTLTSPAIFANFAQFWTGSILFYAGTSLSTADIDQNRDHFRYWHAGVP